MDVTSLGTSPMELALYGICGELNVCLGVFHQCAANIRVIQYEQHGPQVMIEVGECYSYIQLADRIARSRQYLLNETCTGTQAT